MRLCLLRPCVSYREMKKYFLFPIAAAATLSLTGCFGGGSSSAAPPTNVAVVAKDSRVVVTWDMQPGVQYWIWKAAAADVTPQTCSQLPLCTTLINVSSPATISGLTNGTLYSFSVNSRINGGPGGAGSPAVSATPRLAGATWSSGTALGSSALRGVTYGAMFVAVGDGGQSYSGTLNSSINGITWTPLTNVPSTLNAVNYDGAHAKYLSVGTNGTVMALTPATSSTIWTAQTPATPNTLYALANNGTGFTVAVGAGGTIITSGDGTSWTLQSSATALTTQPLYGVAYGLNSSTAQNVFVAVGAAGTVLHSVDGVTWAAGTVLPSTPNDLRGVTYSASNGAFLAVGANGTVLTSSDGANWTKVSATVQTPTGTSLGALASSLNSVTFSAGRRFVAVSSDGNIFYSEYISAGATWIQVTPAVTANTNPLYAVATGGLFDYSAVGVSGLNFYAD